MALNLNGLHENGKAPAAASDQGSSTPAPARDRPLVNVQPARLGDLQPRYAAKIDHQDDNPDAHGWYSALSK